MWGVFVSFLKDKRNMVLGFCAGALVFIEMYVALFPTIQEQATELGKMMESFPKGFMEAFGVHGAHMFAKLESYMSTEFFSFFWLIMVAIMAISFANAICVGEIEKGTIELTLAQPISRVKILLARFFAGGLSIAIFTFASAYGILLAAIIHGIEYQLPNYLTVSLVGTLCGLAFFSMATFFSVLFSERGRATIATTSILLLMYAVKIISGLRDSLENLKYASFFHYFDAPAIFGKNEIPDWSVAVFSAIIITFLFLSAIRFHTRDIAV